ncbi:MAG: glycosyltransferase family 39 protein [Gemmatimonadaceae bacterium]|nr:glycosyltransferase family 39 protein [Gemmatimonadaceae bacterium]
MPHGSPPVPADPRAFRQALLVLAGATALRLVLAAAVPLFPDEAYYWDWSRHLAGGYFDHPPVIAWCIAAGTALLGDSALGVRLVPILVGSSGTVALTLAARRLAGDRAARYIALLFAVLPLSAAGLVLATPDAPLLGALAWTLFALTGALAAPVGAATRWWLGAGLAIGLAMASKFTGVFFPLALLVAFAWHAPLRARFREPGPYLAVAVASAVMAPVLLWNAQHDWIAFRFQLGHGLGTNAKETFLQRELNLVASQFGLVTPILFVLVLGAIARGLRAAEDRAAPTRAAFATIAAFCAAFFVYSATRRNVEANWPAIAWLPALVLLGARTTGARSAWERRGAWLAGTLSAVLLLHVAFRVLPLPARRDQASQAHGWDRLAARVDSARHSITLGDGGPVLVAANRYQDAALLAYHLPGRPLVPALNLGGRRNQYDLWPRYEDVAHTGDPLLLVLEIPRDSTALPGPVRRLLLHFGSITPGEVIPLERDGEVVGRRQLWILEGWDGAWPTDSTDPRAPRR